MATWDQSSINKMNTTGMNPRRYNWWRRPDAIATGPAARRQVPGSPVQTDCFSASVAPAHNSLAGRRNTMVQRADATDRWLVMNAICCRTDLCVMPGGLTVWLSVHVARWLCIRRPTVADSRSVATSAPQLPHSVIHPVARRQFQLAPPRHVDLSLLYCWRHLHRIRFLLMQNHLRSTIHVVMFCSLVTYWDFSCLNTLSPELVKIIWFCLQ